MKTIITRACELTDDLRAVTDLIIETDAYIYPPMFRKCTEERYRFFESCMRDRNSGFYYKNILLAIEEERIIGILIAFRGNAVLTSEPIFEAYRSAPDIAYCEEQYFSPLFKEYAEKPEVACISNLCIHPAFRDRHVGMRLLKDYLSMTPGVVELDVLCDNPPAVHLYEKCGFSILYSEDAFAFEPIPNFKSYRMQCSRR